MTGKTTSNFLKNFMKFEHIKPPLVAPFLPEKITIPNPSSFVSKLNHLRQHNHDIEFVSDFDYTLTKFRHAGRQCDSLFGMWVRGDHLPPRFKEALISNYQEYEIDYAGSGRTRPTAAFRSKSGCIW